MPLAVLRRQALREARVLTEVDEVRTAVGVREAARHPVGSSKWWDGVWQARRANSDHMAEEEDDALADFRRNTPLSVREDLGRQFNEFKTNHAGAQSIDTDDKDPEGYVNAVQAEMSQGQTSSLGIGSLKGR